MTASKPTTQLLIFRKDGSIYRTVKPNVTKEDFKGKTPMACVRASKTTTKK